MAFKMEDDNFMNIFFKDFFAGDSFFEPVKKIHYPVDITDFGNELKIEIVAIGAKDKDISIETSNGDELKVKYIKPKNESIRSNNEFHKIYVNNIVRRSFDFSWIIPSRFDISSTTATLKDGLLVIRILTNPEKKPRKIKVIQA